MLCRTRRPGSEKDITEVSGTSGPGSIPGRGTKSRQRRCPSESWYHLGGEQFHLFDVIVDRIEQELLRSRPD